MANKNAALSPFERKVLGLAWEGRYAAWELVRWVLPYMYPTTLEERRRAQAENTLRKFVDAGLVSLERFHFTKEEWVSVEPQEADAVLSNDEYWQPADIDSWQIRFRTTPAGNQAFEGPPQTKAGWINANWWIPKSRRRQKQPTMRWTLRHVRRYIDRRETVYDFYEPLPLISRFYERFPDDPNDRLCYFWRQVDGFCWTVIRWGSGDDERYLRSYLGLWLEALKLSKAEWRDVVQREKRPLATNSNDWSLWDDEMKQVLPS